tara:strand:- start:38 stop:454 length:417 start_codon:yes stop_codon:yes gene_type:complete
MSDKFEHDLNILTRAENLTKGKSQSEQAAIIGLLKLDPNSIKNEEIKIQIIGVQQNLIKKINSGEIDKSMVKSAIEINKTLEAGPSWFGGRRKRRKSLFKKKRTKKRMKKKRTKKKRNGGKSHKRRKRGKSHKRRRKN